MSDNGKIYLPFSKTCFVCGDDNHAGLRTRFYVEDGKVKAALTPSDFHCGYPNVVHGGIVAAILDECMGWAAAHAIERLCVTGELTIRYIDNVPHDRELTVVTACTKGNRRIAYTEGEILDNDGKAYASATAKFLPLSADETLYIDDNLVYLGDELRLFQTLREEEQKKL